MSGLRIGLLGALVATLLTATSGAQSDDLPPVVVTDPSAQKYRVAVQRFADAGGGVPAPIDALRSEIERALEFSGLFAAIDSKAFLGPEATAALDGATPPDCGDWRPIGADALVEGELRSEPEQFSAEFRIWDVARCQSLLRKRYQGAKRDVAGVARRIADDVVREFTGRSGVASTEIAFISDRTGQREVYVMGAMGDHVRAATRNKSINAFPDWAPNADELVYTSYRLRGQPTLFLLTRGEGTPGQLMRALDHNAPIYRGVFAPSGERLAVVMSVDGDTDIYTARPDGRSAKRLTNDRAIDIAPSWSPDGERLAFVSDRGGSPQVYVMDAKGRNVTRLTFQGGYNTAPAWSPDGRWIAYESRVGGQFDIWLIDPQGEVNVPLVTHSRSDESPAWSPDSRMLVFSSTRRGQADLYRIGIDGQNLLRLTDDPGNELSPAWGPFPR